MTWVLDILRPFATITANGSPAKTRKILELLGAVLVDDPAHGRLIVDLGATIAALLPTLTPAGLHLLGDLLVDGAILQGGLTTKPGSGSTTGPGSAAVLTLPIANGHGAILDVRVIGRDPARPATAGFALVAQALKIESSALVLGGNAFAIDSTVGGLLCALDLSWAANVLTVAISGPSATITAAASAGAGAATLITVGQPGLTSDLTGTSVTIAGTVGTTGVNGAHVATWVSATTFTIPVAWAAYSSGGTVVLTTPPVIAWQASGSLLVTP